MQRIIIFGNSGSGKSTLADRYSAKYDLPHLDLDTLAWQDTQPPTRRSLNDSFQDIGVFIEKHNQWIIEGGYSDLLSLVIKHTTHLIFLNPGITTCLNNCRQRPWEPHKYSSEAAQNQNLDMLLDWVEDYYHRTDGFSLTAHRCLFDGFVGEKTEHRSNEKNEI